MEEGEACEIARLPEELLSAAISRTAPRDACRAAAVSPAFRAAAVSDAVWVSFLPRDIPDLADGELSPAPLSKKELFLRLSDGPLLLPDRLKSMWLDRETGAKCYMLSARALVIIWGDTPRYWRWIPLTDSRFAEGAALRDVCWLEIRVKIHSKILSSNSTYAAVMVFKIAADFYGLDIPLQEGTVCIGGRESTRKVAFTRSMPRKTRESNHHPVSPEGSAAYPQTRADGWMEVELGEFFNEDGEDGEVGISLMSKGPNWKRGLIVQGIEAVGCFKTEPHFISLALATGSVARNDRAAQGWGPDGRPRRRRRRRLEIEWPGGRRLWNNRAGVRNRNTQERQHTSGDSTAYSAINVTLHTHSHIYVTLNI